MQRLVADINVLSIAERDVITRELLEQVTTFPHLREEQARMLKTIAALGPEKALSNRTITGKACARRVISGTETREPFLDLAGIAKAMGVNKLRVKNLLKDTRQILRDIFNRDGCLFASE